MGRLFGTDGVRGKANADLTPELALAVAVGAARTLAEVDRSHPPVAFLVGESKADFGVMLSASHNPMPDNGIKIFAAGGHKLPDELEMRIEAAVADGHGPVGRPIGAG